jgi:hypothetical protein
VNTISKREKLLMLGALALALFVILNFLLAPKKAPDIWASPAKASQQQMAVVDFVGDANAAPAPEPTIAPAPLQTASAVARKPVFPAVWQRDKAQYASEDEWKTWAGSACSAAALASVLSGYGHPVKISDVLAQFVQQDAIKSTVGLYKYNVFGTVASQYGLKVAYSEDKNLEAHFEQILNYLRQGYPVILNVLDATYFPSGHFIVATGLNPDNTVAIMNPDPTGGNQVNQNWPVDGLKLYFSRMNRSAAILP